MYERKGKKENEDKSIKCTLITRVELDERAVQPNAHADLTMSH